MTSTIDGGAAKRPSAAAASVDDEPLHVLATAGHVDHGKSSLVERLTGIDPDRLEEEKRRGLTIDLGFAWGRLPSGREIGFVDVPGHERFVGNMLAGVGPLRRVLFVVAADEGWKPQSEEHLAILDLLGSTGVVALTKQDLVDEQALQHAAESTRIRLAGTVLANAPIVPTSSATGAGLEELGGAIDDLLDGSQTAPHTGRPRLHVDRVFPIRGAGTVVTGTLIDGPLQVGDEVELSPTGLRGRIRGLQSHRLKIELARPVSRVAVNLAGVDREQVRRGMVLVRPGAWRPSSTVEVRLRPIRGLDHPVTERGAFKLHAGSAEVDARLRLYGTKELRSGQVAYARIRLSAPMPFDMLDAFVLREAGRRETVAGGEILDVDPPARSGTDPIARLQARSNVHRTQLPELIARERGAVRVSDVRVLTGLESLPTEDVGGWIVDERLRLEAKRQIVELLERFHQEHPMRRGADVTDVRARLDAAVRRAGSTAQPELVDAILDDLVAAGALVRTGSEVALPSHSVSLDERAADLETLLDRLRANPAQPPTVEDLAASGTPRELIDAAAAAGRVVRVSPELVFDPEIVRRGEQIIRSCTDGITVSAFRERLATSRKYAVPLLEFFDRTGVSRRDGDLRFPRG